MDYKYFVWEGNIYRTSNGGNDVELYRPYTDSWMISKIFEDELSLVENGAMPTCAI